MLNYILRRLLLLPITLFFIVLVNFVIVNLAPGEPITITEVSAGDAARKQGKNSASASDDRYLQFREHFGLTLPILFNPWPSITEEEVKENLWRLVHRKDSISSSEEMPTKDYDNLRILFGDQARFVMPILLKILTNPTDTMINREHASRFFIRGGTKQAVLGSGLTEEQKAYNRKTSKDNTFLRDLKINSDDSLSTAQEKSKKLAQWYQENLNIDNFEPTFTSKIWIFFFETRFFRYMSRVATLDFGTLRNDNNKTVIREVSKRFKYSLTLSIIPMLITLFFCTIFGFVMAFKQNQWEDYSLNIFFLILYAIPVFVVAPFLIEKIALNENFPFTNIPIPINGFTSSEDIYSQETSYQRIVDIFQHIALPLLAILYGMLAAQARLARTAVLEVKRQDYVRTAWAKGVPFLTILYKHIGRNAAITIVTSIAGSLGIILGGSLIVETLFGIDGFGKFFYEAIVNRDYNVIMFSALAGSFLTLAGYLVADIAYTLLDPRLTLE
jgi:peptide/nickel transport system permease protein